MFIGLCKESPIRGGSRGPTYDTATAFWGHEWETPSEEDFNKLLTYGIWTKQLTSNGYNYFIVTGPNKNSIILPISGITRGYWTSSSKNDNYSHAIDVSRAGDIPAFILGEKYEPGMIRPILK